MQMTQIIPLTTSLTGADSTPHESIFPSDLSPAKQPGDSRATNEDLLNQLRDLRAQDAWTEFDRLYRPLILDWAARTRLNDADAQDVAQEVALALTATMPLFRYDRSRQSFRGYLKVLTRWKILKLLRRKNSQSLVELTTDGDRFAIPSGVEILIQDEWRRLIIEEANRRIYSRPNMATYQIYVTVNELGARRAARRLGVKMQTAYNAVHLVKTLLQQEVQALEKESW